jgi:lysophospholipase L1-like esterase
MGHASPLQWMDVREWGVEGKGWTNTRRYFDRLPSAAQRRVTPIIWELSRSPTGMSAGFWTDATEIHARWKLRSPELGEANLSRGAHSGLDLYARDGGRWRWVGWAGKFTNRTPVMKLADGLPRKWREFRVYLPLRNPTISLEIGVDRYARFRPVPPRPAKPIVYYGSSIVHGAFASRPGMVQASILGRLVNRPVINLGFSGQAQMDQPMAHLLGELDANTFIIDPLPNMNVAMVEKRAEAFLTTLCRACPDAGLLLVEDAPLSHAWAKPQVLQGHRKKWRAYAKAYRALRAKGFENVEYILGEESLGTDNEGTVDGIHPNDLGQMRMAQHLCPALRRMVELKRASSRSLS